MGRLFWKFFFFILLAQLLATLTIGSTFWLKDHTQGHHFPPPHHGSPPIDLITEAAASTLQYGGITAFQSLLENLHIAHLIYAVDEQGQDILQRPVDQAIIQQARQWLDDKNEFTHTHDIVNISGQHYVVLAALLDHPMPPPPDSYFMQEEPPPHDMNGMPPPDAPFMHLIPIISAIMASLIFAVILAWYFSKPIKNLRTAFKAVANGNFQPEAAKVMGKRSDELADLSHDVDNMAQQIHNLMNGQQRLLHDVSHELRSPLARMQVLIGLAKQQPEKTDALMERIEKESFRMDELVDELLTLSRLEAGVQQPLSELIDVEGLLADIVEDAELEANAKQCHIDLTGQTHAVVTGNTEMLYRAIENVIRNAVKHTQPDSHITILTSVDSTQSLLTISVMDCGPGVPNNSLEAIFKPFFRIKNAANNDGYGIGLAIAHQVIKTHGGSIKASNRPEGGLQVDITLPV